MIVMRTRSSDAASRPIVAMCKLFVVLASGGRIGHTGMRARIIFTLLGAAILMALVGRASDSSPDRLRRAGCVVGSVADDSALRPLGERAWRISLYGLFVLGAVVVGDRIEMLYAEAPAAKR